MANDFQGLHNTCWFTSVCSIAMGSLLYVVCRICTCTLPKTNIAPARRPGPKRKLIFQLFQPHCFRWYVSFRGEGIGICICIHILLVHSTQTIHHVLDAYLKGWPNVLSKTNIPTQKSSFPGGYMEGTVNPSPTQCQQKGKDKEGTQHESYALTFSVFRKKKKKTLTLVDYTIKIQTC